MAPPQGLFYFAGVQGLFSASFTLTPGITPSVCTMVVAPIGGVLQQGPLTISYGGGSITFKDCIVDKIDAAVADDGFTTWQLSILDRRWKWQKTGRISGYYNTRRGGSADPIEDTKRTPRALARLCFDAMGEKSFDVSGMPDGIYPEVEWDYELPAEALARLCDDVGCRVVLRADDKVAIERVGKGRNLPNNSMVRSYTTTLDPPESPDSLVLVGGRTRYQGDFELEAVGVESDGEIKKIDDLSYKPAAGWGNIDPIYFNGVSVAKNRELAKESVLKWYRIKTPFKLPSISDKITDLDRILPIENKQIEVRKVGDRVEPLDPYVYGLFYNRQDDAGLYHSTLERDLAGQPLSKYGGSFNVDTERGIVKFSEPVYRLTIDDTLPGGSEVTAALIVLRVACNLRDEDTRGWIREEFKRTLPGRKKGTKPRYVEKEDVTREVFTKWKAKNVGEVSDNKTELKRIAEKYLTQIEAEYQTLIPAIVQYEGFQNVSPSGAVTQVTWTVNDQGFASTRAAYGTEEVVIAPTQREMRNIEQMKRFLDTRKIGRVEADDLKKARA